MTTEIALRPAPYVLGITGYAQSGKDSFAEFLSKHGNSDKMKVAVLSLAAPLKMAIESLTWGLVSYASMESGEHKKAPVPLFGGETLRNFMVAMGDFCRSFNPEIFPEILQYRIMCHWSLSDSPDIPHLYVIPDVRRENELYVCDRVIRVSRPGVAPAVSHPTEGELDSHKLWLVHNDQGLPELEEKARNLLSELVTDWSISGLPEYIQGPTGVPEKKPSEPAST